MIVSVFGCVFEGPISQRQEYPQSASRFDNICDTAAAAGGDERSTATTVRNVVAC
jgi:hypothetical protein